MPEEFISYSPIRRDVISLPGQHDERRYKLLVSEVPMEQMATGRTIGHRQTKSVDLFPVIKCLSYGSIPALLIMVVLEVMSHHIFMVALRSKQDAKADRMNKPPEESMEEVQGECSRLG